jgi:predicted AAA+ superfamily ATPase
MIIIHGVNNLTRLVARAITRATRAHPVVILTGARQTGKSTLVQSLATPDERPYFTLDDLDVLEVADIEPTMLLDRAPRMTIDEVQRAPELLHAIKRAVDRHRIKGRFLLTGSANLLLLESVSETLAGRAAYLTLWPMTRREQLGLGCAGIWEQLLDADDKDWRDIVAADDVTPEPWRELAKRGGYPTPALDLEPADRDGWFAGYARTYLERDVQELTSIAALVDLRRLMKMTCLRLGQLTNQSELGRDAALAQPTVHRWLNLLEASYQLVRVHPYAINRTKRLIKTPKAYWADTALALHLSGEREPTGAHLENLVLTDLLAWRDARLTPAEVMYWRTVTGEEVDFVVETEGKLLPIEVKTTTRPRLRDAKHLLSFHAEYGRKCRPALLLHCGKTTEWLTPRVLAAPWWKVI